MALVLILSYTVFISSSFVSCGNAQRHNRSEANARSLRIQCPENQTFCEQVPNYPSNIIRQIMKKNPALLHSYFHWTTTKKPDRISREVGSDEDDTTSSCDFARSVTYPQVMDNTDGQEKNIINNEYYWQPVTLITCKDENSGCDRGKRSFFDLQNIPGGNSRSTCTQKFEIIQLITYDSVKWTGEYDTFQIPSGCVCEEMEK